MERNKKHTNWKSSNQIFTFLLMKLSYIVNTLKTLPKILWNQIQYSCRIEYQHVALLHINSLLPENKRRGPMLSLAIEKSLDI
jgi:hypothetical protein